MSSEPSVDVELVDPGIDATDFVLLEDESEESTDLVPVRRQDEEHTAIEIYREPPC